MRSMEKREITGSVTAKYRFIKEGRGVAFGFFVMLLPELWELLGMYSVIQSNT